MLSATNAKAAMTLPVRILLEIISRAIPRNPRLWVFGSYTNGFSDNAKYLFTHVVEHEPDVSAVWITGSQAVRNQIRAAGGRAHLRWSLAGMYASMRAKYWFFNSYTADINHHCRVGACLINLWHGIPLKKIEHDINSGPLARIFKSPTFRERFIERPHLFARPDFVLSTSSEVSRQSFSSAFRIPERRCLNFGYPRNDQFFWSFEERSRWLSRWADSSLRSLLAKLKNFRKVFLYMPTWRDGNPNFLAAVGWDFSHANEVARTLDVLLILKLHPSTPPEVLDRALGLSHIHVMEPKDDAYPILAEADALITDYSSVYLDFLLLKRPIYFLPFDLESYKSDSRGFYHEYEAFTPGPKFYDVNDFLRAVASGRDDFNESRARLRSQLFDHVDSSASSRIVAYIRSIGEPNASNSD